MTEQLNWIELIYIYLFFPTFPAFQWYIYKPIFKLHACKIFLILIWIWSHSDYFSFSRELSHFHSESFHWIERERYIYTHNYNAEEERFSSITGYSWGKPGYWSQVFPCPTLGMPLSPFSKEWALCFEQGGATSAISVNWMSPEHHGICLSLLCLFCFHPAYKNRIF